MTASSQTSRATPGVRAWFASALLGLRRSRSWSQAEMAERIGLSDEAYGRIERGRVLPRVETLARIAEETGASLDELLLRRPHPGGAGGNKREALLRGIQGRLRTASERELELLQAVAEAVGRWRSGQRKRGTT